MKRSAMFSAILCLLQFLIIRATREYPVKKDIDLSSIFPVNELSCSHKC